MWPVTWGRNLAARSPGRSTKGPNTHKSGVIQHTNVADNDTQQFDLVSLKRCDILHRVQLLVHPLIKHWANIGRTFGISILPHGPRVDSCACPILSLRSIIIVILMRCKTFQFLTRMPSRTHCCAPGILFSKHHAFRPCSTSRMLSYRDFELVGENDQPQKNGQL